MERPIAINVNLSTSGSRLGGAAIAAEFHCRYMAAESFPVELWRMWDKDEEFYLDSLKVRNFYSKVESPISERLLPKRAKKLLLDSNILEEINVFDPEIIHLHNPVPSFAFQRIINYARESGKKVGASTHGFYEVLNPNYGLKPYEKFIWNKTIADPVVKSVKSLDFICSLYPEEKKMLMDMGLPEEKIHLTPNGVNPFFLENSTLNDEESLKKKFNLPIDAPIVLFIGNHTANKGIDTVMEIASKLSYPATFVIGGKLLSANEPQQWQERFPKGDRIEVIFTDYLTVSEQRALYRLSDILLFPSLADTLPLTIIEAMATELPVIAYDVGGISYQLQDGCGIIVKSGDFTGFLSAVEKLISDPHMRTEIAKKAKLRQEEIFSWEKTARTTIDVYKQLLNPLHE
jgi:alpha-maltose-1-phosphate synthase